MNPSATTSKAPVAPVPEPRKSRMYPERPIVGVGGLVYRDNSVLLVKRGKEPGRGMWSIPGGALKVGETLSSGVAREIMEEVGLNVEVGPLVEAVERIFPDQDGRTLYHYVILDFLCFAEDEPPIPGSDAEDARFVPREEWEAYGLNDLAVNVLTKGLDMAGALRRV